MKPLFRNMFPKGQSSLAVIIPKDICDKLELKDKDRMSIKRIGKRIIIELEG